MKLKFTFLILLLFQLFTSYAHKYYFGFAELEYNQMQEKFEGTLIFTAHDLEEYLIKSKFIDQKFHQLSHSKSTNEIFDKALFQDFEIFHQTTKIQLNCLDFFLTKNGLIEVYFSSERIIIKEEIKIHFSSLMNYFPEQQNKITFILNSNKSSISFLPNEGLKTLKLDN